MQRDNKNIYLFIYDENRNYYRAIQQNDGTYAITSSTQPYPLTHLPVNIKNSALEFATNQKYFSLTRSISYPLDFIKDGAAILRNFYHLGKGSEAKVYLTIIEWNGNLGHYEPSYNGKFDFSQKSEDPKAGIFTVPTVDDSVWGLLSQRDDVEYSIECNATNPKAVRIMMDGVTLINRYTFQTVQAPISAISQDTFHMIPFVLVNQDGDSAGIITKNQTFATFGTTQLGTVVNGVVVPPDALYFFGTSHALQGVVISGTLQFTWSTLYIQSGGIVVYFCSSKGKQYKVVDLPSSGGLVIGQTYTFDFEFTWDLEVAEQLYYVVALSDNAANKFTIVPIVTNTTIRTVTRMQPTVIWGVRAIDVVKDIVNQATDSRYTINSDFLTNAKGFVITSGDAIRGLQNAKVYSSFEDFFKTFDAISFMALKSVNGDLFMEKAISVYTNTSSLIVDIGEAIDVTLTPAMEYFANEVVVGSPKQDYRHPSGRLEFNSTNTFSLPMHNSKKKIEFVSKYRLGCYDIQFLMLDYQGGSTEDNSGDKSVYVIDVADELVSAIEEVETFENINVVVAPLEPIIKSPRNNDIIHSVRPTIKGISTHSTNVNVYIDGALSGSTTSDINGNWSYNVPVDLTPYVLDTTSGVHIIDATFVDEASPKTTVTITIYDDAVLFQIIYPNDGDGLYNNIPLIKGTGMPNVNAVLNLDGVDIATVPADGSGYWEYKSQVIPNGTHTLTVNGTDDTVTFTVNNNISSPLITYVGGELDGFPITNDLPLIRGIALPGTIVRLWLNYISYTPLGTTQADANGNWSYQVVPVSYTDPYTNVQIPLAPIRNGLSIVSTSLENRVVGITVSGYKIHRPPFESITGVPDNTVFNVEMSPKRMLLNHAPMLAPILAKQPQERLRFQTADKNANLVTVLFGDTVSERTDVTLSDLGQPLANLEYLNVKVKTSKTFIKSLQDFSTGSLIKTRYRGNDIFALPIGSMKMTNITDNEQTWKLLLSPRTPFSTLMNLYKNGITITINQNSMYHSDYNTLHFVGYNIPTNPKYNFKEMYDDWFENRNDAWMHSGGYVQKLQTTEVITDQIITNGIANVGLAMYRCSDASLIGNAMYGPVSPAPIALPETVLEAKIDLSLYPEDQYFFVINIADQTSASTLNLFHPNLPIEPLDQFTFYFRGVSKQNDRVTATIYKPQGIGGVIQNPQLEGRVFALTVSTNEDLTTMRDNFFDLFTQADMDYLQLTSVEKVANTDGSPGIRLFGFSSMSTTLNVQHALDTGIPIAISERIETRYNWPNTVLIEARSSINQTGAFFSTGFKSVIRVEGLVKKLQPDIGTTISKNDLGTTELIYGESARKREIRFGTAYGLPDYLYLKIASALVLDEVQIEGIDYTISPDEKISPSDDVAGHPLYYYNVVMDMKYNNNGVSFNDSGNVQSSVVLVVGAEAFGLPAGSLLNINLNNG